MPEGLLLRNGPEPMDTDQLSGKMPALPRELLSGVEAKFDIYGPKKPAEPAAWMPDL